MMPEMCRAVPAGATLPLFAIRTCAASATDFSFKMANNSPVTHPQSLILDEAAHSTDRTPFAQGLPPALDPSRLQ